MEIPKRVSRYIIASLHSIVCSSPPVPRSGKGNVDKEDYTFASFSHYLFGHSYVMTIGIACMTVEKFTVYFNEKRSCHRSDFNLSYLSTSFNVELCTTTKRALQNISEVSFYFCIGICSQTVAQRLSVCRFLYSYLYNHCPSEII